MPVDAERPQTAPPHPPSVPAEAVVITYVGQISQQKGVPLLVAAAERLISDGHNVCLWLLGDPSWGSSLLDSLKQQVAAANLQHRIVFFGYVQNVLPLLSQSDIHVCPSLVSEGLTNVVGEAKLCGKPSVVFPTGGLPELIEHKVDGFLCKDCTVEALIEGLQHFLTNQAVRQKASLAAKRSLEEKFGPDRFRTQWAQVFLQTAATKLRHSSTSPVNSPEQ